MGFTDTLDDTKTTPTEAPAEPGDHDRFSHYVEAAKLADAMVFGTPLKALCGKQWVPTRDGLKFPICQACDTAYKALPFD